MSADDLRRHYSSVSLRLTRAKKKWVTPSILDISVAHGQVSTAEIEREVTIVVRRTLFELMREVAVKHNVSIVEMREASRTKRLADARKEFYYRSMMETKYSYFQISAMVNKDHTTAMAGARAYAIANGLPIVIRKAKRKR